MKERNKQIAEIHSKWINFSADLWSFLSENSQAAVKVHAEKYAQWERSRDPLILWELILATHQGSMVGSEALDSVKATRNYYSISQEPDEHTSAFKERVDAALEDLDKAGVPRPVDKLQASLYIDALDDSRYAELKSSLTNDEARNRDKEKVVRPQSLAEAHRLAMMTVRVVARPVAAGRNQAAAAAETVFAAEAIVTHKPKEGGGKKRKEKKGKKGGSGGDNKNSNGGGEEKNPPADGCLECGGAHWAKNYKAARRAAGVAARKKAEAAAAGDHFAAAALDEGSPVEVLADEAVVFTGNHHHQQATSEDEEDHDDLVAAALASLGPMDVLLDNQATIHLFKNEELLTGLRAAARDIYVRGVGGRVKANLVGDFGHFGEVYYCPASPVNVLSFSWVRDTYVVSYSHARDAFFVETPGGSIEFSRVRSGGRSRGGLYAHRFLPPPEGVYLGTVEENKKLFSKRQVAGADAATALMRVLG